MIFEASDLNWGEPTNKESAQLIKILLDGISGLKPTDIDALDIFHDKYHISHDYYCDGDTVSMSGIDALIMNGGTLRVRSIQRYFSSLRWLAWRLGELFGAYVWINAYVSQWRSKGLGCHKDPHTVLALQLFGEKEWSLFESDVKGGIVSRSLSVRPGQGVVIAEGVEHRARTSSSLSVHLAIGTENKITHDLIGTAEEVMRSALQALSRELFVEMNVCRCFPRISAEIELELLGNEAEIRYLHADESVYEASFECVYLNYNLKICNSIMSLAGTKSVRMKTLLEVFPKKVLLCALAELKTRNLVAFSEYQS